MKTMLKIMVALVMIALVTGAYAENTFVTKNGNIFYQKSDGENETDASVLAYFQKKVELADEAALDLIQNHGVKGTQDEVAAIVLATQQFSAKKVKNEKLKNAGVIAVVAYLSVNADEVASVMASNTTCFKKIVCNKIHEAKKFFRKAMSCKKRGDYGSDYQTAVNKAKSIQFNMMAKRNNDIGYADKAVEADPDNDVIKLTQAELSEPEESEKIVADILTREPGLLESYIVLGNSYYKKGDYDMAIFQYKKALQMDPDYALTHYSLAQAYEKKGEDALAKEHMAIASAKNVVVVDKPVVPEVDENPVVVTGAKVADGSEEVTKSDGIGVSKKTDKINEEFAKGNYDSALELAKKKLESNPTDKYTHYQVGLCYYKKGEYEKAAEHLVKNPAQHSHTPFIIGKCFWKLKRYDDAYQYLHIYEDFDLLREMAIEKNPKDLSAAYFLMNRILFSKRNHEKALKFAQKSIDYNESAAGYFYLGGNYYQLKNYEKAYEALKKAHELAPDSKDIANLMRAAKSKL